MSQISDGASANTKSNNAILKKTEEEMRKAERKRESQRKGGGSGGSGSSKEKRVEVLPVLPLLDGGTGEEKDQDGHEEKLKQARIRLTMGRERRTESQKRKDRLKYVSNSV